MLSTLATYFLGDSVFQWTMIVSVMLFSMGLGSRFSQLIRKQPLLAFMLIELLLSVLVSYSSLIAYVSAGLTVYTGFIIYSLSIAIGILIGMEIPLVIRLNKEFESLRVNVASVMEKDYWGSLAGGVFFVFVGLPYLGLTYTPFVLGSVNFAVALILAFTVRKQLAQSARMLIPSASASLALIAVGFFLARPIILFGEQKRYADKVVYAEQSKYQRIVITEWKDEHWLFINGSQQLSSLDEDKYHEPLVHPAMQLNGNVKDVLILGGGDGCAVRELLKYDGLQRITLVDLDPAMTNLGLENPILLEMNDSSLHDERVQILNQDGFQYLSETLAFFDVIIVDLPDPKSVDLNRLYTQEFYQLCYKQLRPHGVLITQAGSPYYATKAFKCIDTTMASAGFVTCPLHNQVLTLGEWGWMLGVKETASTKEALLGRMRSLRFEGLETKWLNSEAMLLMTSFGKDIYFGVDHEPAVNRIHDPVLYQYYLAGNWDLY